MATLYDDTGQGEKAVDVAKRVLSKEIKIESEAVEEIKKAMARLVSKY